MATSLLRPCIWFWIAWQRANDRTANRQPLYRQHQRLGDNGIKVSRPWLTQLTHGALSLLEPIFTAQLDSIRASRIKAMDETPIKAGRAGPGKMKGGYFWPVYGERDEICFAYHEGRSGKHIAQTLGTDPPPEGAVLLTDGYAAYERYAEKCGLTHAQCWAHSRRKFFDAQALEPERAGQALEMIGKVVIAVTLVPLLGYTGVIVAEPIVWVIMVIPLIVKILKMPELKKTV